MDISTDDNLAVEDSDDDPPMEDIFGSDEEDEVVEAESEYEEVEIEMESECEEVEVDMDSEWEEVEAEEEEVEVEEV